MEYILQYVLDMMDGELKYKTNSLILRINRIKVLAVLNRRDSLCHEYFEALEVNNNIELHYLDRERRNEMISLLNGIAEVCKGPKIMTAATTDNLRALVASE
jgi:hypothetical protein